MSVIPAGNVFSINGWTRVQSVVRGCDGKYVMENTLPVVILDTDYLCRMLRRQQQSCNLFAVRPSYDFKAISAVTACIAPICCFILMSQSLHGDCALAVLVASVQRKPESSSDVSFCLICPINLQIHRSDL
jgi:hypothetical protein